MINPRYKEQVSFLLQLLPYVAKEKCFALKGGTAINLFIRDLPRLSVDIDLTYLPFDKRDVAMVNISEALKQIKENIERSFPDVRITSLTQDDKSQEVKLVCNNRFSQVKIEVNTTMRGHLHEPILMKVSPEVGKFFNKFAAIQVVSMGELFGGKICAALDRQHPRDLFDVYHLLEKEGFTEEIKTGFIAAFLSHPRPMNEVLNPTFRNQKDVFASQFAGMTMIEFSYEDYTATRERLSKVIKSSFSDNDKQFIMSVKEGTPDWRLSPNSGIEKLPAVQWKLLNINKLKNKDPKKHGRQVEALRRVL